MRIAKSCLAVALPALVTLAFGCATAPQESDHSARETGAQRSDVLYFCACGPECTCNTLSTKPGECACGKALKWGHVVKVEEEESILCTCNEGCKCSIDEEDPTTCECGLPFTRVSLKGSALYFCSCGGSCVCNMVSESPGECTCGMQLRRAD